MDITSHKNISITAQIYTIIINVYEQVNIAEQLSRNSYMYVLYEFQKERVFNYEKDKQN